MPVTVRRSGEEFTLKVELAGGVQTWDLSDLSKNQLDGVREMVVNDWCRRNGERPLYGEGR